MTKEKRTNFRFKSERQRGMVFAYIRELKQKDIKKKDIAKIVKAQFNLIAHNRTIEGWISNQSCMFSDTFLKEQYLMNKWNNELQDDKPILSQAELQLEEMYCQAKSRGINV